MEINILNIAFGDILVISTDKNGNDLYTRVNSNGKWRIARRDFLRVRTYPNTVVIDNRTK